MKNIIFLLFVSMPQLVNASENCAIEKPDPDGYLNLICDHIVENKIDVSPGKPDKYQIREIVKSQKNGEEIVSVYLDCCYLGDFATIDPKTKKVTSFELGAK